MAKTTTLVTRKCLSTKRKVTKSIEIDAVWRISMIELNFYMNTGNIHLILVNDEGTILDSKRLTIKDLKKKVFESVYEICIRIVNRNKNSVGLESVSLTNDTVTLDVGEDNEQEPEGYITL